MNTPKTKPIFGWGFRSGQTRKAILIYIQLKFVKEDQNTARIDAEKRRGLSVGHFVIHMVGCVILKMAEVVGKVPITREPGERLRVCFMRLDLFNLTLNFDIWLTDRKVKNNLYWFLPSRRFSPPLASFSRWSREVIEDKELCYTNPQIQKRVRDPFRTAILTHL